MGRALQLQMLEAELQDHIDSIPWISLSLPSAVSIDTLERWADVGYLLYMYMTLYCHDCLTVRPAASLKFHHSGKFRNQMSSIRREEC